MAILLVGGWGQVRERPPKTCAVFETDLGLLYSSICLYCPNRLFSDWPLDDLTRAFNTSSRQRVVVDDMIS